MRLCRKKKKKRERERNTISLILNRSDFAHKKFTLKGIYGIATDSSSPVASSTIILSRNVSRSLNELRKKG
jgi:hypothetical protein